MEDGMEDHDMADGKSTILDTDNMTGPSEGQSRQPTFGLPTPGLELENPFITSGRGLKTKHRDATLAPTTRPQLQRPDEPANVFGQEETRPRAPFLPVRPFRIRKATTHTWLHTIPETSELEIPTRNYAPSANHTFHQLTSPVLSRRQARPRRSPSNPTLVRQRTSSFSTTYTASYQLATPRPLPVTPERLRPALTQESTTEPNGPVNTAVHLGRRPDAVSAPHVADSGTKEYRIGWHNWTLAGKTPFSLFQRRFTLQDANTQARLLAEECCEYHKGQKVLLHKVGDDGEEEWIVTTAIGAHERNNPYSSRNLGDGRKVLVRVIVYAHEEEAN